VYVPPAVIHRAEWLLLHQILNVNVLCAARCVRMEPRKLHPSFRANGPFVKITNLDQKAIIPHSTPFQEDSGTRGVRYSFRTPTDPAITLILRPQKVSQLKKYVKISLVRWCLSLLGFLDSLPD